MFSSPGAHLFASGTPCTSRHLGWKLKPRSLQQVHGTGRLHVFTKTLLWAVPSATGHQHKVMVVLQMAQNGDARKNGISLGSLNVGPQQLTNGPAPRAGRPKADSQRRHPVSSDSCQGLFSAERQPAHTVHRADMMAALGLLTAPPDAARRCGTRRRATSPKRRLAASSRRQTPANHREM